MKIIIIIGILLFYYCIYKLMKAASIADMRIEEIREKEQDNEDNHHESGED